MCFNPFSRSFSGVLIYINLGKLFGFSIILSDSVIYRNPFIIGSCGGGCIYVYFLEIFILFLYILKFDYSIKFKLLIVKMWSNNINRFG